MKIPVTGKGPFAYKIKKDGEILSEQTRNMKINEIDGLVTLTLAGVF